MIRCSNIPNKYLLLSLIIILVTAACTHWSPRVNRYGLPERKFIYHQPDKIDDGWETASLNEADIDSGKINEMMLDILIRIQAGCRGRSPSVAPKFFLLTIHL